MSSKEFDLESIDLAEEFDDNAIQSILGNIEKKVEVEESDVRFIKDIRIVKIE